MATDPAGPRLTFYDDASGERVELSTTTLANWVAKTTNLLVLECGVGPGARVSLHLPRHWTTAVWALAADAVGAEVDLGADEVGHTGRPDVAVVGPQGIDDAPAADEVFAVSLAPLGAPFRTSLPALVRDYAVEVRLMPDQLAAQQRPGRLGAQAELQAAAGQLQASDRVAGLGALHGLPAVVDGWLAPLSVGASVVWVRNPDPVSCVPRWATERVTAVSGEVPPGVVVPEGVRRLD